MRQFGISCLPTFTSFLVLALKMAVTAGFVVAATVTVERAGPLVGGLVAAVGWGLSVLMARPRCITV